MIVLLTGPAGAGKNTTAQQLVNLRKRLAVIDVDDVRHMIVQPHLAPWEGEAGWQQHRFGAENSCVLAKRFADQGYDVVLLNVVGTELAALYRTALQEYSFKIVRLLPRLDVAQARNDAREKGKMEPEIVARTHARSLEDFNPDLTIDNSDISAAEVAQQLSVLMDEDYGEL